MVSLNNEITDATEIPRWVVMWALAAGLFALAKWVTFRDAKQGITTSSRRALGYLLLWPGMDARAFLDPGSRDCDELSPSSPLCNPEGYRKVAGGNTPGFLYKKTAAPRQGCRNHPRRLGSGSTTEPVHPGDYLGALLRMTLGAFLLWDVPRFLPQNETLLIGWVGMFAMILILHFGLFALLSAMWRRAGVDAQPLMNRPSAATSLAEFWGFRWNRGFHDLARRYVFIPLQGRLGSAGATLVTFVASGLVHELVISVPAGGGYGLPTGYFILQGLGVLWQRSSAGRRWGLRTGCRGRATTLLITAGPAFWLFPPIFVRQVIVPFMAAIHAL